MLEVLKKRKIATTKEIVEELEVNETSVRNALKRMAGKDIEKMPIRIKGVRLCYAWKIIGYKIPGNKLKNYDERKEI